MSTSGNGPLLLAWGRLCVPRALTRVLLPVLWIAAVAWSTANADHACTPARPSACGPDFGFAWAAVPLVLALVLPVWMPLAGCVAGIAFGVLDVLFDDVPEARPAWVAYATVCLLVGVLTVLGRVRQRVLVRRSPSAPAPEVGDGSGPGAPGLATQEGQRRAGAQWGGGIPLALVLAALGAALLTTYGVRQHQLSAHERSAVQVEARVLGQTDESELRLALPGGGRATVEALDAGRYPIGTTTPVLVEDPADLGWVELVAEPGDVTYWLSGGLLALAVAALVALRAAVARRARIRLLAAVESARGIPVTLTLDELGDQVEVRARPEGRVLATAQVMTLPRVLTVSGGDREAVPYDEAAPGDDVSSGGIEDEELCPCCADEDDELCPSCADEGEWDTTDPGFGAAWRGEAPLHAQLDGCCDGDGRVVPDGPLDAVAVGALADGGWAGFVTADAVLLPLGPLRPPPLRRWPPSSSAARRGGVGDEPVREAVLPGRPADESLVPVLPDLPVVLRPARGRRVLDLILGLVLVAAPAMVVAGWPSSWSERLLVLGASASWGIPSVWRLGERAVVRRDALHVVWGTRATRVPWSRVHGARVDGSDVLVATDASATPIALTSLAVPRELAASPVAERAAGAELAAALLQRTRRQALAAGSPGGQADSRPSLGWWITVAYLALAVGLIVLA